jgi:ubiquinone/menaquinone biosynthesis C-methylase UbiE
MRTDWDAYARCYDNLVRLTPYKATLNTVAQQVLSRNPRITLDASCGTGNFEATLSSLGFADQVVGVDFSEEMLTRAKNG